MDAKFISGIELSERYFKEVVKPILDQEFPGLKYSSALIGWGSEVLGFDTEVSRDHNWGPRLLIMLNEKDYAELQGKINLSLSEKLPHEFMGYPTSFSSKKSDGV